MAKVYQVIASTLDALQRCNEKAAAGGADLEHWRDMAARHTDRLHAVVKDYMPSGSGFDNGTTLDPNAKPERLVFLTSFHHMNECGMYDGWTDHSVIVKPSFVFTLDMRITGRDRNDIKELISQCFHDALETETSL